jgi:hypothetical protein
MLIASSIAILIVPEHDIWDNIKNWKHIIGISIAFLSAAIFAFLIYIRIRKRNDKIKQDIDKGEYEKI